MPLSTVIPYDKDDLLVLASPLIAFRIVKPQDEAGNFFSIKDTMESSTVFACPDFNKRAEEFAKIFETRIERYFETGRASYIFFDEEEQAFIKGIFRKNVLISSVLIYIRPDNETKFKQIDYVDLNSTQYMEVNKHLRKLKAICMVRPELYYSMYNSTARKSKDKFEEMMSKKEQTIIEPMLSRYPKLKDIKSKQQLKKYYRYLSKKYHPDLRDEDEDDISAEINKDFEDIKQTRWYTNLPDCEVDEDD